MTAGPPTREYFGARLRLYQRLGYVGLALFAGGFLLAIVALDYDIRFLGVSLLNIGLICGLAGWAGAWEERRKYGLRRTTTFYGTASLLLGAFGALYFLLPGLGLALGGLAIGLGHYSVRKGDTVNGRAGFVAGIICVIWLTVFIVGAYRYALPLDHLFF